MVRASRLPKRISAFARCLFQFLQDTRATFSPAKKAALAAGPAYLHSVKLAFEAARFWERGSFIFGGLAWTDRMNENVIYPSGGYGAAKGVVVGSSCAAGSPGKSRRLRETVARGTRACQPQVRRSAAPGRSHLLGKPITVAWGLTRYSEGVGALWPDFDPRPGGGGPARGAGYAELLRPEGPIVFAGERLSYQPTWQEGAALSAQEAMKVLSAMARDTGRGRAAAS